MTSKTLHLSRPIQPWRKRLGLAIAHMVARKAKAKRMSFYRGAKV